MAYTNTDRTDMMSGGKFWSITVLMLMVWSIGLYSGYTLGGVLHVLLLASAGMLVVRVLQANNPIAPAHRNR